MAAKRVLLWVGNAPNQKALACKIASQFELAGIVAETPLPPRRSIRDFVKKGIEKILFWPIDQAWFSMLGYYRHLYPAFPPGVECLRVPDINDDAAYAFTQRLQPDIILVSGTKLVRKRMLSLQPPLGILNLHTGVSPYVKGGPNCTNWCLALGQYHMIGNTIMWIDAGIDSGNLVATEFTPLTGDENLQQLHIKVMEHGHDLYARTLNCVINNTGKAQRVDQKTMGAGNLYLTKMWTWHKKLRLLVNFYGGRYRAAIQSPKNKSLQYDVRLVKLP